MKIFAEQLIIFILLQALHKISAIEEKSGVENGQSTTKIICYFTNWSTNRTGKAKFNVSNIDSDLCTHLIYSFATLNPVNLTMEIGIPEIDIGEKMYEQVTQLKSKGLKVSIALGGWIDSKDGSKYSRMINTGSARTNFIHNAVKFIRKHNFDGLDMDWEYPKCFQGNCTAGPVSDRHNFATLIKELRKAFSFHGLLLSVAVSADTLIAKEAYKMGSLGKNLDWIGIMTYDFHSFINKTNHHSPYMGPHPNSVDAIDYWISHGVSPNKLIMGFPLYGRSFTLLDENIHGIGAPATIGRPSVYTDEPGFVAYFEFCNNGFNFRQDLAIGSYAFKGDQWVSFNDLNLIQEKAEHIKQYQLGGALVWSLDLDDFNGEFCNLGKYPMLKALYNSLKIKTAL